MLFEQKGFYVASKAVLSVNMDCPAAAPQLQGFCHSRPVVSQARRFERFCFRLKVTRLFYHGPFDTGFLYAPFRRAFDVDYRK